MTQNEKELLLKDLCGRLPYGVVVQVDYLVHDEMFLPDAEYDRIINIDVDTETLITNGWSKYHIDEVRPYLFPMSSMTKEQKNECFNGTPLEIDKYGDVAVKDDLFGNSLYTDLEIYLEVINWLLKNHFDIYGLIKKGLAIDATNLNIY